MSEWVYTTRRMELIKERASLSAAIEAARAGLAQLLSGEITSYNLGHYSISRYKPDLDKLQKWIEAAQFRIYEIDCIMTGQPVRKVSTCVYANPQFVRWGLPL